MIPGMTGCCCLQVLTPIDGTNTSAYIAQQCWVVQNSHDTTFGYGGYINIVMDLEHDCGILSFGWGGVPVIAGAAGWRQPE